MKNKHKAFIACLVIALIVGMAYAQTPIYRSVGPWNTNPLAQGSDGGGNGFTISGSVANFANPLPDTVGVGDALVRWACTGAERAERACAARG